MIIMGTVLGIALILLQKISQKNLRSKNENANNSSYN